MNEEDEFAEALIDQLSVEISEEHEIERLAGEIASDADFGVSFEPLDELAGRLLPEMVGSAEAFTRLRVPTGLGISLTGLDEFKMLKARKVYTSAQAREYVDAVFAAVAASDTKAISALAARDMPRFLVYSTYAKSYLSKISTTYGDYMDSTIHLNSFVLSRYPQIILYKQGKPYGAKAEVGAGYAGAVKMTVLEEAIHSMQSPLEDVNRAAVAKVNLLNEELASVIMSLGDDAVESLTEYLKLQRVPNDLKMAGRANLFFALNPDNFVARVLGPDVMMYTNVEVDPKIRDAVPELPGIYERWLGPIQAHHAAFTVMEGMAEFVVRNVLGDDPDFESYLRTFAGTDMSAYRVRKSIGRDFVKAAYEKMGGDAFGEVTKRIPTTRDLKNPTAWLDAAGSGNGKL